MPGIPRTIVLVGFMASGKTHVGRELSRLTGCPMVDADDEIVLRAGKPIHRIFQESGEAAFRDLERSVIRDLCSGSGKIIATGGGAFIDPDNRERMLAGGLVFYLSAQPETIHRRIRGSEEPVRPLLEGKDTMDRIRSLLAQRAGVYARAHHTIETDLLTPEQVARQILRLCRQRATAVEESP